MSERGNGQNEKREGGFWVHSKRSLAQFWLRRNLSILKGAIVLNPGALAAMPGKAPAHPGQAQDERSACFRWVLQKLRGNRSLSSSIEKPRMNSGATGISMPNQPLNSLIIAMGASYLALQDWP